MKAQCSVEKLKNAIALADRMSGRNLTLPLLQAVLISAKGKSICVRATNLNVGIEIEIPATVTQEGSVVVKGDVVASVCSNLPPTNEVLLTLENDNLTLQSDKTTTVIKSLPAEEFPALPVVEGDTFEIKTTLFEEGVRSVAFAAATSEIKPEISSVYVYAEEGVMTFVATDSFRLAEKKLPIKNIPDISKILIPYKNIADLLRVVEVIGDKLTVTYSRNQLSFRGGGVYFTSRLIDGGFPPYTLIIPKEENTKVVVLKQDLLHTLKLSTLFVDTFFQISFKVDPVQKQITISSKNSNVGSSQSLVDSVISGEAIEVVCNLKYFLDVLQVVAGDSVALSFTTPTKAIAIRSVQDKHFLYLLMPANR
ncbi:MAG TPA: DNA polymerase III subunit beta [Candidatus Paceibacterota bacterium]|nr:DNA polymerase III subunit beta [Candidatus Paceibacterota bacterium]